MHLQWIRGVDGQLVNLAYVRRIKVDTWSGDDYGVTDKQYISVLAVAEPDKDWDVLARGFSTVADAQAWINDHLGWLVTGDGPHE